jgi:hypothetical protein
MAWLSEDYVNPHNVTELTDVVMKHDLIGKNMYLFA